MLRRTHASRVPAEMARRTAQLDILRAADEKAPVEMQGRNLIAFVQNICFCHSSDKDRGDVKAENTALKAENAALHAENEALKNKLAAETAARVMWRLARGGEGPRSRESPQGSRSPAPAARPHWPPHSRPAGGGGTTGEGGCSGAGSSSGEGGEGGGGAGGAGLQSSGEGRNGSSSSRQ